MESNLDKYLGDLERLISTGQGLFKSFERVAKGEPPAEGEELSGSIFKHGYQGWYSEARAVIKQILPDRLEEFDRLYEEGAKPGPVEIATYSIKDWLLGIQAPVQVGLGQTRKAFDDRGTAFRRFQAQLQMLGAAGARFESALFDIKQLLQADIFDSEIEAARELTKKGFLRAAGAVAGVVLEKHLAQVCQSHDVTETKKNPSIADLNNALRQAGVIDMPDWRRIEMLGYLRNLCDHKKEREPKREEVADLIDGVDKIMKSVF